MVYHYATSHLILKFLWIDDIPTDERVLELQGDAVKVIKALESVVGHLRKFLVDHSVLPLFEKRVSLPLSICIAL